MFKEAEGLGGMEDGKRQKVEGLGRMENERWKKADN